MFTKALTLSAFSPSVHNSSRHVRLLAGKKTALGFQKAAPAPSTPHQPTTQLYGPLGHNCCLNFGLQKTRSVVYIPALAITSRKTLRSSALTCSAVLQISYNRNCPEMIAPDHTMRLGSPRNSPPRPKSSTIVLMVAGIDDRSGLRFMVLSTVSAVM